MGTSSARLAACARSLRSLACVRPSRPPALVWRAGRARPSEYVSPPAASLGAPRLRLGRRAMVSPQAQFNLCAPLFLAPSALPANPHPKRCALGGGTSLALGAPRIASLSSAASASVLARLPPCGARSSRPRPVAPHVARRFALGSRLRVSRHPLRGWASLRPLGCAPRRSSRGFAPAPRVPAAARRRSSPAALPRQRLRRYYALATLAYPIAVLILY